MFIFPHRCGAEGRILHTNRFFNTSQCFEGNQIISEFPSIDECQEKNNISYYFKGKEDDDTIFSQKSFALVHLKI